jgi:hypothetical protein
LLINLINETQVAKPKNQALTPNQGKPQKEFLKLVETGYMKNLL